MKRRTDPVEAVESVPVAAQPVDVPAARPAPHAHEAANEDPYVSRWLDWLRQFEHVQASSLKGFGSLLEATAERASTAHGWTRAFDVAGGFLREAVEETTKRQAEWLAALTQCQMQAAKMLVDLGDPPGSGEPRGAGCGSVFDPLAAWYAPWLAWSAWRPVQVA